VENSGTGGRGAQTSIGIEGNSKAFKKKEMGIRNARPPHHAKIQIFTEERKSRLRPRATEGSSATEKGKSAKTILEPIPQVRKKNSE